MKFRNYCLIVMGVIGDSEKVILEIEKVSETKPNILDAKGVLISTFTSVATPQELNNWFKDNKLNLSFLVFDLDKKVSGFHITKKEIHDGLFGFLNSFNIDNKTEELLRALDINVTSTTKTNINSFGPINNLSKGKIKEETYTESTISKMTEHQKLELTNKILDKGVKNLTYEDKNLLQLLAK